MSILSDRLRNARISAKLTLEELSVKSGISQATLQRYETGANIPTIDKVETLIKVLNVSYSYLNGNESLEFDSDEFSFISNLMDKTPFGITYSGSKDSYFVYPPEILNDEKYDDRYWETEYIEFDNNIEKIFITPSEMKKLKEDIDDYALFRFYKIISNKKTTHNKNVQDFNELNFIKLDHSLASKK